MLVQPILWDLILHLTTFLSKLLTLTLYDSSAIIAWLYNTLKLTTFSLTPARVSMVPLLHHHHCIEK